MELSQIGLLKAKAETTYGVDSAPDHTSNNIAVKRGLLPVDPEGDAQDRDLLEQGFARVSGSMSMKRMTFKVQCELRGNLTSGASNTDIASGEIANAIEIDPLLRACDLAATYTAESSDGARDGMVVYAPTTPTNEGVSLTIIANSQQKYYHAVGCKGVIDAVTFEAGKFPLIDFTFQGLYRLIGGQTLSSITPVFLATKPPLWANGPSYPTAEPVTLTNATNVVNLAGHGLFNGDRVRFGGTVPAELSTAVWYYVVNKTANTFKVSATLNGAAVDFTTDGSGVTITTAGGVLLDDWTGPVVSRCVINLGQTLEQRADGNITDGLRGFHITNRLSTGEIDPESVANSEHPFWTDFGSRRNKALRLTAGTLAGNRVSLEAKLAMNRIQYEDRNGRRIQKVQFALQNATPGETPQSDFRLIFQ